MFSKTCEYGIRAVTYIAMQSMLDKRVKMEEISKNSDTPMAFTAKILRILTKNKIVSSRTGPNGGFYIEDHKMKETMFSDIVDIIDGNAVYSSCAFGLKECSNENPCPMHENFKKVKASLKQTLNSTSLYDLAMGLKSGKAVLM